MGLGKCFKLKSSHEILSESSTGPGASRGSLNFYPAVLDLNLKGPWSRGHLAGIKKTEHKWTPRKKRKKLKPPEKK